MAASLLGRKVPTIQLTSEKEGESVVLAAELGDHIGHLEVVLWQASEPTGD